MVVVSSCYLVFSDSIRHLGIGVILSPPIAERIVE